MIIKIFHREIFKKLPKKYLKKYLEVNKLPPFTKLEKCPKSAEIISFHRALVYHQFNTLNNASIPSYLFPFHARIKNFFQRGGGGGGVQMIIVFARGGPQRIFDNFTM